MKGNHNGPADKLANLTVVFNISKIQNERKSQLCLDPSQADKCCVQHIKDTK